MMNCIDIDNVSATIIRDFGTNDAFLFQIILV